MKTILRFLSEKFLNEKTAYAHCDIPCGIYDTHNLQLAAHTIIRMTQLLEEVKRENPPAGEAGETKAEHDISRITRVKEKHADIVEEELSTLRNDYFKEEHYKEYSNLNDLFVKTLKTLAKARQGIDVNAAEETLMLVLEIAEIFYKTKNVEPVRVKSVYPTEREVVLYK